VLYLEISKTQRKKNSNVLSIYFENVKENEQENKPKTAEIRARCGGPCL
jgi:hypothetical protein